MHNIVEVNCTNQLTSEKGYSMNLGQFDLNGNIRPRTDTKRMGFQGMKLRRPHYINHNFITTIHITPVSCAILAASARCIRTLHRFLMCVTLNEQQCVVSTNEGMMCVPVNSQLHGRLLPHIW